MSKRSKADVKYAADLLWTHQVRRENAFLHKEVERLREEVKSTSDEIGTIKETLAIARPSSDLRAAIAKIENVQHDLATTLGAVAERTREVSKQAAALAPKINDVMRHCEQSTGKLVTTVQQFETKLQTVNEQHQLGLAAVNTRCVRLENELKTKVSTEVVDSLLQRIDNLEKRMNEPKQRSPSPGIVIDSIEEQADHPDHGE